MSVRVSIVLVALAALLSGCDDLVGYDVGADGRVLAALDADDRAALVAEGTKPRELVWIDPRTGAREKLTREALPLAGVRALGKGAVAVEARHRLVAFSEKGERRLLLEVADEQRLFAPAPSPDGARVAVVEARRLGEAGVLHVLDATSGAKKLRLEGVLPGVTWTGAGLVVGRMGLSGGALGDGPATEPGRTPAFEGELAALEPDGRARSLGRGLLAPFLLFAQLGPKLHVVVPTPAKDGLALAAIDSSSHVTVVLGSSEASVAFASASPDGTKVVFTRSPKGEPTLEGELLVAPASDLAAARKVPTRGPVSAPRWTSDDQIVYLVGSQLVAQDLEGKHAVVLAGGEK